MHEQRLGTDENSYYESFSEACERENSLKNERF
jgi:hypothetical protein